MDIGAILERFLDRPRVAFLRAVLDTYGRAAGGLMANGLAFAALFATIPVALVSLGLAGLLVDDPRVQAALAAALIDAFPPLRDLIDGSLEALTTGAPVTSVVGVVGLVWTVSQLYVTLDVAFARLFSDVPERHLLGRTARGFAWFGLVVLGVVGVILLASLAAVADALLPEGFLPGAAISAALTSVPALAAVAFVLVAVAYRVIPPRSPDWTAIRLPAFVVALAMVALTQGFALLAPRLVGVAAIVGTLATVFIALAWLSLTFQALLLGAAWVRVRADRERASALLGAAAPAEPGRGRQ